MMGSMIQACIINVSQAIFSTGHRPFYFMVWVTWSVDAVDVLSLGVFCSTSIRSRPCMPRETRQACRYKVSLILGPEIYD